MASRLSVDQKNLTNQEYRQKGTSITLVPFLGGKKTLRNDSNFSPYRQPTAWHHLPGSADGLGGLGSGPACDCGTLPCDVISVPLGLQPNPVGESHVQCLKDNFGSVSYVIAG